MDFVTRPDASTESRILAEITSIARRQAGAIVDLHSAEDLAQEIAFECMLQMRAGRWHIEHSLTAYVRAMVRRRRIDDLRQRKRRTSRERQHALERGHSEHAWMSPELALRSQELERFHERTLASLAPRCRRAYIMVREGRASYLAVASRLGISRSAVCSHVVAAQRRFREGLIEQGIVVPGAHARETTSRSGGPVIGLDSTASRFHRQGSGPHFADRSLGVPGTRAGAANHPNGRDVRPIHRGGQSSDRDVQAITRDGQPPGRDG